MEEIEMWYKLSVLIFTYVNQHLTLGFSVWDLTASGRKAKLISWPRGQLVEDHYGSILIVQRPHTPEPMLIVPGVLWFSIYYIMKYLV